MSTTAFPSDEVPDEGIFDLPKPDAEVDEDEEVEDFSIVVTEPFTRVDPASITAASPKKYIAALLGASFEVQTATTRTLKTQAPFKTGARAGERKPDVDTQHLWLFAFVRKAAGMLVHFEDNRFKDAKVWDAAGWPTELWANYKPSANKLKRVKDEPERAWQRRVNDIEQRALEMEYAYNDGVFWVDRGPRLLKKGIEFEEWLHDLIPSFVARKPPKKTQKQAQATATAAELIEIGSWIG